jgi:DnaJ-class molecular chaperone
MKVTDEGMEFKHEEAIKWMEWYGLQMRKSGVQMNAIQRTMSAIANFFQSGYTFAGLQELKPCPRCDGTGKSKIKLYNQPAPVCGLCEGTGLMKLEEVIPTDSSGGN